jgi:hypothetical protein
MHQQLWGYKVEWKSVSRGTGGKRLNTTGIELQCGKVQIFGNNSNESDCIQGENACYHSVHNLEVKRPGRETDHSPPPSADVKNAWNYTSSPQYAFMA